ncbi:T9SS type A sorting domain-containing protein [Mangrovimonas sp. YM274]|uniref:T9SS type A sorting domain-containing protein n=1 Tax=Mangrovimonas sp. YM274 TaxID=3070660 RepID=UPI0027DE57CB|nr:T9SS type A sorting domain-containing protein [Mangrovimonas sp. YM274]WMI69188.1 T9SS type A sorting domain-containing protein [Mangrovimonas sp. YM274]
MKKVTLLFMLLCSLITYSQIGIVEDFDSYSSNQNPTGWTGDFVTSPSNFNTSYFRCGSVAYYALVTSPATKSFTTPNQVGTGNGTDLAINFNYKIVRHTGFFGGPAAPDANWGTFTFEYSTNGTDWTEIGTIDDDNYTYDGNCHAASYTIDGANLPEGSDFQFRATLNVVNNSSGNFFASIDDLSILQSATEVPNCDVSLTSETTDVFIDTTITWSEATGLPTGYNLSVGSQSGVYDIVDNVDVETATTYDLTGLEYGTTYYVLVSPYNGIGTASCTELTFTTVDAVAPNCDAAMTSATTEVPINTTITWSAATGYPTGYNIAMGVTEGDYTVVASTDAGDTTSFQVPVTLAYSTTYYVLITPYNEFGNATDCTVYSFVTRDAPIQGAICEDPIVVDIDSGDYSATAVSLDAYEDNYDDAPCNAGTGSTMAGNEIVYAIAPLSDVSVDIAITNIVNQRANVYLLDSCVDVAEGCLASAATGYATPYVDLLLEDQVLMANNIYYIVISTFSDATENNTQFDINVTANDCINPSATLTAVPDCDNGEYSVEVDVTYFGDASTLIISDGVNDDQELDAIGTVTFGPYTNGSTQSYTMTSDLGCNITETITYYCAPTNDACIDAIDLTLSTDETCDNSVAGYTYAATLSSEDVCNTSYQDVWYTFTPTEDGYYNFTLDTEYSSPKISVLSGSCDTAFTSVGICSASDSIIRFLTAGTQYYIPVYVLMQPGVLGYDFNICVYKMPDAVANDECSDAQVITESDENGSNTITGTHENAYFSTEMENCGSGLSSFYEDVWYSFTPQYTGTYHINLDILTGSNVFYSMFSTSDCASISTENRVTSSCSVNGNSSVELVAGTTYLLDIHSNSNSEIATFEFYIYPDASLSTADVNFEGFRYYPNPVKNTLTFESPNMISSVAIYNVVGQKVLATADNDTMSTVNMGALPNGIYFAKVTIDGAEKTIKIIKE